FGRNFLRTLGRSALPLAGAFVAAELAANAIRLGKEGRLTAGNLFGSVDWLGMAAGYGGALVGSSLLVAALGAGPLGLVALAGGVGGGMLAQYLLNLWRNRNQGSAVAAAGPAEGTRVTLLGRQDGRRPGDPVAEPGINDSTLTAATAQ